MANGLDLGGKVALVTGGNGGIGLGMAEGMAAAGADVVIWGSNPQKNSAAEEKLRGHGRRVLAQRCDVADEQQVDACFAEDQLPDEWQYFIQINVDYYKQAS